jgi:hypothetical protein
MERDWERPRRARIARDALRLREAVLAHLGAHEVEASRAPLIAASPDAWAFLLRVECCALPLVTRLRADGTLDRLDDASRAPLLAAEKMEMQRVLAARLLIRELDVIGERAGVRFTLLKGGAVAADPTQQPLDLGDVDALAARESTERAWNALLACGWTPVESGLAPDDELGARPHYAPLRSERHQLPLELHAQFDYGLSPAGADHAPETAAMAGYRAIDRLAGARAIAATLRHSVVVHPHRRGHLRDLFLLSQLLRDLDDEQLRAIERDLRSDAQSAELLAMLAQSRALSRGEPLPDPEVLRPFVSLKYAVEGSTSRLLGFRSPGWNTWSFVVLERPALRRAMYRRLLLGATERIDRDWSPLRHPILGSRLARALGLARLVRVGRRAALVVALIALGGVMRRHVRALNFRGERG